jgi:hypothetical protein
VVVGWIRGKTQPEDDNESLDPEDGTECMGEERFRVVVVAVLRVVMVHAWMDGSSEFVVAVSPNYCVALKLIIGNSIRAHDPDPDWVRIFHFSICEMK